MYFFLRQDLFDATNIIEIVGHTETSAAFEWTDGVRFDRPVPPFTLLLDPSYGTEFPDFFDTTIPVMSARMVDGLRALGISNFDAYPVTLRNAKDGSERTDFFAINVVGVADAVDPSESPHRLRGGKPKYTGAIVIDPTKTNGLGFFRLERGPSFIVVTEDLAKKLIALGLTAVLLQPIDDYTGT